MHLSVSFLLSTSGPDREVGYVYVCVDYITVELRHCWFMLTLSVSGSQH